MKVTKMALGFIFGGPIMLSENVFKEKKNVPLSCLHKMYDNEEHRKSIDMTI